MEDDNDDENGDDDEYLNCHNSTNFQARISRFCSFFHYGTLDKNSYKTQLKFLGHVM